MSSAVAALRPDTLDRMVRAVEKVRERLLRTSAALEAAGIPYAVVGGNAVAVWVAQVDEAAVRNTRDVDILLRRSDLEAAKGALARAGFVYRHVRGLDIFRDGPEASVRDSVHVLFAGEALPGEGRLANPDVSESERAKDFRVISLEALVRTKLNSWRDKDRTHLRDFLEVGLIDELWIGRFPGELNARLQHLIDTPGG
jgi:hypothetical protein